MNNYELAELDYKSGMKYKDIAEKYGVTVNTVKSWKQRYNWIRESTEKKTNVCTQTEKGMHTKKSMHTEEKTNLEEPDFEYVDDDGLTDKQRLFCYYYMQSFNAAQAAIKAGYSENYARSRVYDMLANVSIKLYLNKLKEQQKSEFLLSQERILNRHSQIAFSDINDYINADGTLKENTDGTLIKKITVKTSKVEIEGAYKENSTVSIELEDRKDSLKFLTKYLNLDSTLEVEKGKNNDEILPVFIIGEDQIED